MYLFHNKSKLQPVREGEPIRRQRVPLERHGYLRRVRQLVPVDATFGLCRSRRILGARDGSWESLWVNHPVSRVHFTATPSSRRRVDGVGAMLQQWWETRRDNLIYALQEARSCKYCMTSDRSDIPPTTCVEIHQCVGCTRQFFRRVDGVEDDAMIRHERGVIF